MHIGQHLGFHIGGLLGSVSAIGQSSIFQAPAIKSAKVLNSRPSIGMASVSDFRPHIRGRRS